MANWLKKARNFSAPGLLLSLLLGVNLGIRPNILGPLNGINPSLSDYGLMISKETSQCFSFPDRECNYLSGKFTITNNTSIKSIEFFLNQESVFKYVTPKTTLDNGIVVYDVISYMELSASGRNVRVKIEDKPSGHKALNLIEQIEKKIDFIRNGFKKESTKTKKKFKEERFELKGPYFEIEKDRKDLEVTIFIDDLLGMRKKFAINMEKDEDDPNYYRDIDLGMHLNKHPVSYEKIYPKIFNQDRMYAEDLIL